MRKSLVSLLIFIPAFAIGMYAAYAVGARAPRGFVGLFRCDGFGLAEMRIDRDLKVFGKRTKGGASERVGSLNPRRHDLATLELSQNASILKTIDPLADYIVDNAGDALLILEMQGELAKMSYVCRRD